MGLPVLGKVYIEDPVGGPAEGSSQAAEDSKGIHKKSPPGAEDRSRDETLCTLATEPATPAWGSAFLRHMGACFRDLFAVWPMGCD